MAGEPSYQRLPRGSSPSPKSPHAHQESPSPSKCCWHTQSQPITIIPLLALPSPLFSLSPELALPYLAPCPPGEAFIQQVLLPQPVLATTHTSIAKTLFLVNSYAPACYSSAAAVLSRCSVVLCSALWYSAVLFGALWYSAVLFGALWYSAVLCGALWYSAVLFGALWYSLPISPPLFSLLPPSSSLPPPTTPALFQSAAMACWDSRSLATSRHVASVYWMAAAGAPAAAPMDALVLFLADELLVPAIRGRLHLVQAAPGSGSGATQGTGREAGGEAAGAARAAAALDALRNSSGSTGQSHSALEYVLS
ncbi:unnamed protein product [Closterium sp. Naga37s-1]|nr:unnamed protein product [Closterium sp. Naga37s-1]